MKHLLVTVIVIAVLLGIGCLWLYARPQAAPHVQSLPSSEPQAPSAPKTSPVAVTRPLAITHTVGNATATPLLITVGTSTQVTVTVQITDPTLIPNSVNLLRLGVIGTQATILGQLQSAGNGVYTFQQNFNEPAVGFIQLQVSAAFRGALNRALSNTMTVGVGVSAPVGWMITQDDASDYGLYDPVASAAVNAGGVDTRPDITITSLNNPSALSLSNFFTSDENGWFSTYQSVTTTTISGHQAIVANDLASPVPRVPRLAAYISQGPTSVLVVTAEASSQGQFNSILQSLQLP